MYLNAHYCLKFLCSDLRENVLTRSEKDPSFHNGKGYEMVDVIDVTVSNCVEVKHFICTLHAFIMFLLTIIIDIDHCN